MRINSILGTQNSNAANQLAAYQNAQSQAVSGAQQNYQNQYNEENKGWNRGTNILGTVASVAAPIVTGLVGSDERLKHYQECSKKVVMRTPSKISALKINVEGMKK